MHAGDIGGQEAKHWPGDERLFLYTKALDEAADGVQITDLTGHIIYSNKAIEHIYGFTPGEYLGKHVNEMNADPVFAEQVILPSIMRDGRWQGELLVKHKNGSVFPIWLSTSIVNDDSGKPVAMVGVIRDITPMKQASEALEEQLLFANAINRMTEEIIHNSNTRQILEKMTLIVGETLGMDRTLIYDADFARGTACGLCEWDNPQLSALASTLRDWNLDLFKNVIDYIKRERSWLESHIDDVSPLLTSGGLVDLIHNKMGAKSVVYYPFSFHSNGFYLLIFHQVGYVRKWHTGEWNFINTVAKHVEMAIQKIHFLEERRKAEQEIWEEKERAQVTLQSIGDAVITTDVEGNVEYINHVAEDLTGWTLEQAKGRALTEVFRTVNEETGRAVENPVAKCLREGRIVGLANHTILVHRDGHRFAIEDSASPIRNRQGQFIGAILVFHDVSEKRDLLRQMMHQAYHDPLTGLPNRILFNDRLKLAIAQAMRDHEMAAVLFLDLDRFKQVNDMLGHAKGDQLLKEVAAKLARSLRKTDTVARLGGDEFAVLLPRISHVEDAAKIARSIIESLDQPWKVNRQEFHISASLGIALYPNDGKDAEALLKHADTAMYRAKERGRNNYQLYTPAMNKAIMKRFTLERELWMALKRDELAVYYQPQVNVKTGRVTGLEALVRWHHPKKGIVQPDEFIALAEETGLIVPIGEWVLQTACSRVKAWQEMGLGVTRISVNISACQFEQQDLADMVEQALRETGLDACCLELEITESALMKDVDAASKVLSDLKNMGVKISIDDFGTGYSSLHYLKRFPIHTLKIDRSFVTDVITNPEDAAIVSAVIAVARSLNLKVIAEGVETMDQLAFLRKRKCMEVQGYLFSRPIPAEETEKVLKSNVLHPPDITGE